jgi:hypothetical protein
MAQAIRPENSVEKNELVSKRHASLCSQVPGAEVLAQAISAPISNLSEKIHNYKIRSEESTKSLDVLIYNTSLLKNQLRNTADKLKGYDRDHPGSNTMGMVFPNNLTPFLTANPFETTKEVSMIIPKLQTLGIEHPAAGDVPKIMEKIERCSQSIIKCNEADANLNMAKSELEISHGVLIKQYNINILEAKKMFGNDFSDNLFPKSRTAKRNPSPVPSPAGEDLNPAQ